MNEYRYYIKKSEKPVADIVVLELADIRGVPVFDFQPGQYVMISYRNGNGRLWEKHTFSIASSPLKKDSLRLGIRLMGKFTTGLAELKVGHEIYVSGPFGRFVFDEGKHSEAVFIAGGVGITPFVSSLAYATEKQLANKMSLLYSSRTLQGAVFAEEILELEGQNENMRALFSITEEKLPHKYSHIIEERISAEMIQKFIGHPFGKTFFLCGPVPFMDAMRKNLAAIGAHPNQIETEEFSMIPDTSLWLRIRNTSYAFGVAAAVFAMIFYAIQSFAKKSVVTASPTSIPANTNLNQPSNSALGNQTQPNPATVPAVPSRRTRVS